MTLVTCSAASLSQPFAVHVSPGSFEASAHFYPRVLNAQLHPLVGFFFRLDRQRLVERYVHLNPHVSREALVELLAHTPRYLRWAGADLFHTTTARGRPSMVVIETNSCASGNKSMPLVSEEREHGGYADLLRQALLPYIPKASKVPGELAVVYDKNHVEASGYAATLADLTGERVWLAPLPAALPAGTGPQRAARFEQGGLEVRDEGGSWRPIRAALRYVTQKPWTRIPIRTSTVMLNPVIACLAGGRNKLVASKAYDLLNGQLAGSGLQVRTPETITDLRREEVPLFLRRFGGHAVVKVPYSNAGQGVFTITSAQELDCFMNADFPYDRFVVQSLIGNYQWSSEQGLGRLYHVGTVPNRQGEIFAADVRVMVAGGPQGFVPVAVYARRARRPLPETLDAQIPSWDVLGTNLSEKSADGGWSAETERLLLMDRRDFNLLGLGIDDLIEAFIQTVLSVVAIDRMAEALLTRKGELKRKLFLSLNEDEQLLAEIGSML